jgi:predicted Rossmann fold nucleotide-binding protein DprA/Smf involved in DNA uptake
VSEGTNKLIAEGFAQIWMGGSDQVRMINDTEIYKFIENEALTADDISRKTGLPVSETGARLSMMLVSGEIKEKGGKYYPV